MVVRGAAGRKIPHSRVFHGETLYFMEKGSVLISATATVKSVQNYVKLSNDDLEKIEDVVKGTSIPYNYENSKFKNEKETAEIVSTMTITGIL